MKRPIKLKILIFILIFSLTGRFLIQFNLLPINMIKMGYQNHLRNENSKKVGSVNTEKHTEAVKTETDGLTENTRKEMIEETEVEVNEQKKYRISLPGVSETNIPTYKNFTSPDNYSKLIVNDDFSCYYPEDFFNFVYKYGDDCYIFCTNNNLATMYISVDEGSGDALKDVQQKGKENAILVDIDNEKSGVFITSDEIKDGWAHTLIGGNYYNEKNGKGMYKIIVSNGEKIYTLDFEYESSDTTTYYTEKNYMMDCLYRYCEHSGTSYKVRTWDMFLHDNVGEKK